MVLESSIAEAAQHNDDDPYAGTSGNYPAQAAVPTMPGFSERSKQRFIAGQLHRAQREFGFEPTPAEQEALAYYHAQFYVAQARGARNGLLAGMAVAYLFTRRQRRPGFVFRALGRLLPLSPAGDQQARHQRLLLTISKATNFGAIAMLGPLWGMTSSGVSAFNHLVKAQRDDPTMRRYVELRSSWIEARRNEARAGVPSRGSSNNSGGDGDGGGGDNGEANEQSLGGLGYYGDNRPPVDYDGQQRVDSTAHSTTSPSPTTAEDPFFGDDEAGTERTQAPAEAGAAGPGSSWRNRPQSRAGGGGSAWDRIRRGERSVSHPDRRDDGHDGGGGNGDDGDGSDPPSPPSPPPSWPRRPAMKGFETQQQDPSSSPSSTGMTTKGDSFTFSQSDRDRSLAKEEAQREFDERVERERRGEGVDGFVNEGPTRR